MPITSLKFTSGSKFITAVRKALGIDVAGQRVIIDAKCDSVVKIYFQGIGDDRLLSLDLETLLADLPEIVILDNNKKPEEK